MILRVRYVCYLILGALIIKKYFDFSGKTYFFSCFLVVSLIKRIESLTLHLFSFQCPLRGNYRENRGSTNLAPDSDTWKNLAEIKKKIRL
jgi:hypothetical protein